MGLTKQQDAALTAAFGTAFGLPGPSQVQPPAASPEQRARDEQLARLFDLSIEDFDHAPVTSQPAPTTTTTTTQAAPTDDDLATMRSALDVQRQRIEALGRELGIDPAAKPRSTAASARAPELEEAQRVADARAVLVAEAKREAERRQHVKAGRRIDRAMRKAAR